MKTVIKRGDERIQLTVRHEAGHMTYQGLLDEGLEMAFFSIPTPERRLALIRVLEKVHKKLSQQEVKR